MLKHLSLYSIIICLVIGCVGQSKQSYYGSTEIFLPDGTKIITDSKSKAEIISPLNAKEVSTLNVGPTGITSSVAGSWEKKINDLKESGDWIFYTGSLILITAGIAVAFIFKSYVFGGILAVSGLLIAGIPSILNQLGTLILIFVICLIVLGVGYLVGKYVLKWNFESRAIPAIAKLKTAGKDSEAMAIARAIDPRLDKEFKNNSNG